MINKKFALLIPLILLPLLLPSSVYSQDSPIRVGVNKAAISTDEMVVLTVTVVDDSAQQPRPILPRLDGLAVVDLDIATDVSMVNGQIQTEVTYTYLLQPRRTGLLTIPPVTVKIDGQLYKAPPISIKVNQGSVPSPMPGNAAQPEDISPPGNLNGQDFFVESLVDLTNPYVGQQLIYTFRFYQALEMHREPQYESPLFNGFDTIGMPMRQFNMDVAGRSYLITEIRTALFPERAGQISIGQSRLMLSGTIYEEPVEFYTDAIQIQVKPLPDDPPFGFNGAVGQYQMRAWFTPEVAVINQPSTLFVEVRGVGNLSLLPELTWPEVGGWQAYNSLTSLTTELEGELLGGERVYERVMIPDQIGEFLIPSIELVYFDPFAADYEAISTEPLTVKVVPPPTAEPTPLAILPSPTSPQLRPVFSTPAAGQSDGVAWTDSINAMLETVLSIVTILFFTVCGAAILTVVGAMAFVWWQQQQEEPPPEPSPPQPEEAPLEPPAQQIHPVLAEAMQQNDDNYRAIGQALNTYLSQMLASPVHGLTRTELSNRLRGYGLDEPLIARIEECLLESEMGRYGPPSEDGGWPLMATADALLFELDRESGRPAQAGES